MKQPSIQKLPVIMLIDDTPEDLYINNRVIQKFGQGNNVNQFNMATNAIAYLNDNKNIIENIPDIIFLDIRMPRMNGFEFLDEYENLPASVKTKCKVYMLSSSFDPRDIERAKSNPNVKAYFEKPLNKNVVDEIINKTETDTQSA